MNRQTKLLSELLSDLGPRGATSSRRPKAVPSAPTMAATARPSTMSTSSFGSFQALHAAQASAVERIRKAANGGRYLTDDELHTIPGANRYSMDLHLKRLHQESGTYSLNSRASEESELGGEILEQLRKHNVGVYETRVAKAYVNECLARGLYMQKAQGFSEERRAQHRDVVSRQRSIVSSVASPRTRKLRTEAHLHQTLERLLEREKPRFHDVDSMQEMWDVMNLRRRGIPDHLMSSGADRRSTTMELAKNIELPPIGSLMNPRNVTVSPLPDLPEVSGKLLPTVSVPTKRKGDEARKLGVIGLDALSGLISRLLNQKRTADVQLRQQLKLPLHEAHNALVPMSKIVEDFMAHECAPSTSYPPPWPGFRYEHVTPRTRL